MGGPVADFSGLVESWRLVQHVGVQPPEATAFETCPPDPRLAAMILCYWRLEGLTPGQVYRAVPKRHVEFVVNIGPPQLADAAEGRPASFQSCWLTGLRQSPIQILPTGHSTIYGVRFRDFAVPEWLTGDSRRSRQWSTDLSGAAPAQDLSTEISACRDLESAAIKFDTFFLAQGEGQDKVGALAQAVQRCEPERRMSPAAILDYFEGARRRARHSALEGGGLTLRRFARLARFDRALVRLAADGGDRIADVAVDVGYYDEAHMTHDFAQFGGVTPAAYRRARQRRDSGGLPHHMFVWG